MANIFLMFSENCFNVFCVFQKKKKKKKRKPNQFSLFLVLLFFRTKNCLQITLNNQTPYLHFSFKREPQHESMETNKFKHPWIGKDDKTNTLMYKAQNPTFHSVNGSALHISKDSIEVGGRNLCRNQGTTYPCREDNTVETICRDPVIKIIPVWSPALALRI